MSTRQMPAPICPPLLFRLLAVLGQTQLIPHGIDSLFDLG